MKFLISKNDLSTLIGKIQNVIPLKPTIPILANLLIEAANDELVLTGTDLTVGMKCFAETKILEEGAITISAKRFFQLIRELPNVNLEITTHPNEIVEVVGGTSRFRLNGMRKDDYPAFPDLTDTTRLKIAQKDLKDALFQTAFAVSREDNRFTLTGVFLQIHEGIATFVGTDGKRLSKATAPIRSEQNFSGSAIIPLKAIEEIQKSLSDDGDAELYLMADKLAVGTDRLMLVTKLLSGEYPEYQRIIPEKSDINIILHREELLSCLRQISLFTSETHPSARFTLQDGELTISSNHSDLGEGTTSMSVNYSGAPLHIAFQPLFFIDILKHSKDDTINLALTDAYNPGIITDSSTALFLMMPMRLFD